MCNQGVKRDFGSDTPISGRPNCCSQLFTVNNYIMKTNELVKQIHSHLLKSTVSQSGERVHVGALV